MYREGKPDPAETLFIAHVPVSMVKNILSEKKLHKTMYGDDLWTKKIQKEAVFGVWTLT